MEAPDEDPPPHTSTPAATWPRSDVLPPSPLSHELEPPWATTTGPAVPLSSLFDMCATCTPAADGADDAEGRGSSDASCSSSTWANTDIAEVLIPAW
eukprot:CAMPEP_0177276848 /NCGR_PEP_ID=MMETSP0367-20130122/68479_1 /TAXON_ID=447022 ORGANISM="Scrippsiella hangoei-like, Strain SHHI-4" /NCGR_SAMPLE_ID=MMETSP0367 /ASSEMBLY_ACC=CAM_ASM_000362 /LENGTH=96 /DNA_ID=CAMNT_0018733397 /DNA_START=363 /DNA_END=650 /DNA_ORIENTATION=+